MKVQLIKGTFKNALKKKKRKRMPYKTHLAFTHLPYFLISLWYNTIGAQDSLE